MKSVRRFTVSLDCAGSVALEFALVIPLLLLILMSIVQFAVLFNNMSILTNATGSGALYFSQGRSFATPYSSAVAAIQTTAGTLNQANLGITISVNGVVCANDAACQSALGQGGMPITVTVTYPCPQVLSTTTLQWLGIDTSRLCPLSSMMTALAQ
jgi:Flp pilus assembly protein TadG